MTAAELSDAPKVSVGVRIPQDWLNQLDALETVTQKSRTTLLLEAIGSYLGEDVETVCDAPSERLRQRIQTLEQEVAELKKKLQGLAALMS